jgi:hypothetical protein
MNAGRLGKRRDPAPPQPSRFHTQQQPLLPFIQVRAERPIRAPESRW